MNNRMLACLILALISSSVLVPVSVARDSLAVSNLVNPVTIDGKWTTPDEWSDTQRVSMYVAEGPESTAFLRIKYDDQYLYVLVDFVSDTTPAIRQPRGQPAHWSYDGVTIAIDKHANQQKSTDEADLVIVLMWWSGYDAPEPVAPPDAWIEGAMSYTATNDPDSQTSHATYELAIPMQMFEKPSAIRASVWDISREANMHWPAYEGSWSTKYFGGLIFSQKQETTTHEESNTVTAVEPIMMLSIAIVVVLVVLALMYFGRRRRVSVGQAQD
jgi:hypothetical protein